MEKVGNRLHSLQPGLTIEELLDGTEIVTDRRVLNDLQTVVRVWAHKCKDRLPDFFFEEVTIVKAERQAISAVVLDVQNVRRELDSFLEAHDDTEIDTTIWQTTDLFQLVPFEYPCLFPDSPVFDIEPVKGREELVVCDKCFGEAHLECQKCSGSGQIECPECEGAGASPCGNCDGAGSVLSGNASVVQCSVCRGVGIAVCSFCNHTSVVRCDSCADGTNPCKRCEARGTLIKRWRVGTTIKSRRFQAVFCKTEWSQSENEKEIDGDVLKTVVWLDPARPQVTSELRGALPQHLYPLAKELLLQTIRSPSDSCRDTGLRARVLASNLYRVELDHNGSAAEVIVGGLSNHLIPLKLPERSRKLGRKVMRTLDRAFSVVGLGLESKTERNYLQSVERGQSHLLDKSLLGPGLCAHKIQVRVSASGYDLSMPDNDIPIQVAFESISATKTVLCASIILGAASREILPRALALNVHLDVGFIGLRESLDRTLEELVLVDRRPYEFATANGYAAVLRNLHRESLRVREVLELR